MKIVFMNIRFKFINTGMDGMLLFHLISVVYSLEKLSDFWVRFGVTKQAARQTKSSL